MIKLFKKKYTPSGHSLEELEEENKRLKAAIKEFRIKLHWRGVVAYRPLRQLAEFDKHFNPLLK